MAKRPSGQFTKLLRSRTQRRLLKKRRSQLRVVTKAERLEHPDRFSPKGSYLVPTSVKKVTARTAFITRSSKQDYDLGVAHSKAAELRKEGRLGYGPRGEERAIPKSVTTYRLKRAPRALEYAEKPAIPDARRRKHRAAKRYLVTDAMRGSFFDLRDRKLNHEFLDDGDWHELVDMARAMNDPMLSVLLKS
jgi:hypothetical protein